MKTAKWPCMASSIYLFHETQPMAILGYCSGTIEREKRHCWSLTQVRDKHGKR